MKKNLLLVCLLVLSFFVSCENDSDPNQFPDFQENLEIDTSIPGVLYGAELNGRRLPDGTTTRIVDNGSKVELTYPEGIKFVSVTTEGAFFVEAGTCYACSGNCTSGCDVFYIKKKFACNQCENGSSCTGSSVPCAPTIYLDESQSGYVDFNAGISFVKNGSNINNNLKGPGIKILMQIPEVLSAMKKFNKEIYGTEIPDYSKVSGELKPYLVNLFGSIAIYKVPQSYFESARTMESNFYLAEPGKTKCACTSGTSGCTYDSGLGYEMCESGACVTCRMQVE